MGNLRARRVLILSLTTLVLVACSRSRENESKIRINFPSGHKATYQTSVQTMTSGWGVSDPSTLSDIVCFAVAVGSSDSALNNKSCTNASSQKVLQYGIMAGLASAEGSIEVAVPAGSKRTISIIGFAATSASACVQVSSATAAARSQLSMPRIIGSTTRDLPPGNVELSIDVSLAGAIDFEDCNGKFFNSTATSLTPAVLTLTGASPVDFGTVGALQSGDMTVTISNTGGQSATGLTASGLMSPYGFVGGSFPGTGGTCSSTLPAAASCTMMIRFSPSTSGTYPELFTVAYNDGSVGQTFDINLTGIAVNVAELQISNGPTYDYGTIVVGSSVDYSFTVNNVGLATATSLSGSGLAAPFTFKGGSYPGTGGTCGASLAAAASCTIVITYAPVAAGVQTDAIDVGYNNGISAQSTSRAVQGTGTNPAVLSISDGPTYDFGSKPNGSSTDKTFTITNTGSVAASSLSGAGLAAPFTFKGGSYPGTGGTCGATLAASGTCTVVVTYGPAGLGAHADALEISYNDGVGAQLSSRNVQGTGVAPAMLALSDGPTYDYGLIANGASVDKTFTVTNSGSYVAAALSGAGLAAPFTFKGGSYPGTGGTCAATLAAAGSCTVVVTYSPMSLSVHNDTLEINYDDGVGVQIVTRDVMGVGASPATISISDGPTYDFGSLAVLSSADKTFTLTNVGGVAATAMNGSGLAAPFTFKGGAYPGTGGTCAASLATAANCTVVVTFSPTATILSSDQLDINYNDGVTGQVAQRAIQGTGL